MRILRGLIFALAVAAVGGIAMGRAAPAATVPVTVSFSPQFESRLRNEYGVREGDVLRGAISDAIQSALAASAETGVSVEVVLESAKPTHPTREQMSREPGIDFLRSKSLGGADLTATLRGADGRSLGRVTYSYYAPTLQLASQAGEAWADARISIQRFATQVAAKLKAAG